jgi:Protein of unknown function (DUF1501)
MQRPFDHHLESRRAFLGNTLGLGSLALSSLLDPTLFAGTANGPSGGGETGAIQPLHHAPKAKRVIFLYMAGGPSHLETFDYKPELARLHGKPIPPSITQGKSLSPLDRSTNLCVGPQVSFAQRGRSGQWMSELFPKLSEVADELCVIRSMKTDTFVHDPAHTLLCTGSTQPGHPSIGSWLWYGLGNLSANLPGYVLLFSLGKLFAHPLTRQMWDHGFLPARYKGVEFRSKGDPVLYLGNLDGVTPGRQRDVIDAVQALDKLSGAPADDLAAHVSQYEMAFRLQTSVPELVDLSTETEETLALYGTRRFDGSFAANCLLARRLAERGVRFVQLIHLDWDHHKELRDGIRVTAREVDQGTAALLKDLKRRGLLDDTLVIWGGEFGRTPVGEDATKKPGRDHHNSAFSMWLAGGGVKAGYSHGRTDELGFHVVEDAVHVHDLHATLLHLLGVDHERLTYRHQGRDFRLTDTAGKVVRDILA